MNEEVEPDHPDISHLIDGDFKPSELDFSFYNRLLEAATIELPNRIGELSDDQLKRILGNLGRYSEYLTALRVPPGWARRELKSSILESVFFVSGLLGMGALTFPWGLLGLAATGGSGVMLLKDLGNIGLKHSIQDRILLTLSDIERIVELVTEEDSRRSR